MSDVDDLSGRLRSVAGELEGLSRRLRSAAETAQSQDFHAADRDGLAEVTVDGRPRVTALTLHSDLLRRGSDELDRLLTGLLNDAVGQARTATRQALFEALPAPVRAEVEDAVERQAP